MHHRILFLVLILLLVQVCIAQPSTNSIQLIAKPKKDGIWLRWAPANHTVWQLGNKYGYIVERFSLKPDGELGVGVKISEPFKPLSSADLLKLGATVEEAEALDELIYKTNDEPGGDMNFSNLLAKKEELENRFGVALLLCDLSIQTAQAAGLFFKDTTAVLGQRYIYRVSLAKVIENLDLKPAVIVVDMTEEMSLMAISDLQAEFRDSTVMLSWSTLMHEGTYSLYYIEKSTDGRTFKRVTDMPYAHLSTSSTPETAFFIDSLDMNAKTYYYRISGVTPFGENGPPSNVVRGEGKNNLAGLLIIREAKIVENQVDQNQKNSSKKGKVPPVIKDVRVNLSWEFPIEEETRLSGFVISRALNADGPYTDIGTAMLPGTARSFTDVTDFQNTYYRIAALDKSKEEVAHSLPFLVQAEDNTPPEIPIGLLGSINSAGVVNLSWERGRDSDLMGYRIFRANSTQEDPVEITKSILGEPKLIDTINMNVLNKKLFYYVVAVDKNYNASDYSAPLIILRPDKRPPVAPVFTRVEVVKDSIVLNWMNSPSDDVAKTRLIIVDGDLARTIVTWTQDSKKNAYFDKPPVGKTYQYKLVAEDSAGNKSEVITRKIFFETGYRNAVQEIEGIPDREKGVIFLSWKSENSPLKSIIYRKENNGPFKLYKAFEGDVSNLIDKGVVPNNLYSYRIQLVYPGGVKSILSKELEVKF